MQQRVETVIVGAGQAGLAVGHVLARASREHLLIDRGRAANAWRDKRWDSFRLVIPNRYWRMPGMVYDGSEPDGFLARNEVVARFDDYLGAKRPPLLEHTPVRRVSLQGPRQFLVQTAHGDLRCRNVVVATGPFQAPALPAWREAISPDIAQLHSEQYRNPSQLPPGAVLVTGSGQSGVQIAEELLRDGRRVFLCTGARGWLPRRYRGRDITTWYAEMGLFDTRIDEFPSLAAARASGFPQLAGDDARGHTLNVHTLARAGAVLLGRAVQGGGHAIRVAGLAANLDAADAVAARAKGLIDQHIATQLGGIAHDGHDEWPVYPRDGTAVHEAVDLRREGIRSIVWAGGYSPDYAFLDIPVLDAHGRPQHRRGVTEVPGLFFTGLEWLHRRKSSTLMAGDEDAAWIAAAIAADQPVRSSSAR